MTVMTPLPTPPSTSDPANFDARADAFLAALPLFQEEVNALGTPGLGGGVMLSALDLAPEVILAAAVTTNVFGVASNRVVITGNGVSITSLGSTASMGERIGRFTGSVTLVNSAGLIVQGGRDYTTTAGDSFRAVSDSSGVVRVSITRASGQAIRPESVSGLYAVAQDAVAVVDTVSVLGQTITGAIIAVCTTTPGASAINGVFYINVGTTPSVATLAIENATNINTSSGALTGTTGATGKITISADATRKIYIENRISGTRSIAVTILTYR